MTDLASDTPATKSRRSPTPPHSCLKRYGIDGRGREVDLCGQAASDHPEFAAFLVNCGIDFLSVSPDSFLRVKEQVARAESAGDPS
ncbi:MAG: putative PEP-binding protein [Marinobacter sp.]|uniref:putative PEP-binding protein n=1 Tax=Marinobacter sp. TaxID=50741 RepID=UPI00396DEE06